MLHAVSVICGTMVKVCANLSFMFQEVEKLQDRYTAAAEAGFTAVECAFPYSEDKEELAMTKDKLRLKQVSATVLLSSLCLPSLGWYNYLKNVI